MTRILSQHGNVIAADFRPPAPGLAITIEAKSEILFCDGYISILRSTIKIGDGPAKVTHGMIDHTTGNIVTL